MEIQMCTFARENGEGNILKYYWRCADWSLGLHIQVLVLSTSEVTEKSFFLYALLIHILFIESIKLYRKENQKKNL